MQRCIMRSPVKVSIPSRKVRKPRGCKDILVTLKSSSWPLTHILYFSSGIFSRTPNFLLVVSKRSWVDEVRCQDDVQLVFWHQYNMAHTLRVQGLNYLGVRPQALQSAFYLGPKTLTFGSLDSYLKDHGDLVSRLMTRMSRIISPVILMINPLTKSPDPPRRD